MLASPRVVTADSRALLPLQRTISAFTAIPRTLEKQHTARELLKNACDLGPATARAGGDGVRDPQRAYQSVHSAGLRDGWGIDHHEGRSVSHSLTPGIAPLPHAQPLEHGRADMTPAARRRSPVVGLIVTVASVTTIALLAATPLAQADTLDAVLGTIVDMVERDITGPVPDGTKDVTRTWLRYSITGSEEDRQSAYAAIQSEFGGTQEWRSSPRAQRLRTAIRRAVDTSPAAARAALDVQYAEFSQPRPFMMDGKAMIPLRAVAERLGATVSFRNPQITIDAGTRVCHLTLGDRWAVVDGRTIALQAAPVTRVWGYGKITYVPLRFVGEVLDAEVSWDPHSRVVKVQRAGGQSGVVFPLETIPPPVRLDTAVPPPLPERPTGPITIGNHTWEPSTHTWKGRTITVYPYEIGGQVYWFDPKGPDVLLLKSMWPGARIRGGGDGMHASSYWCELPTGVRFLASFEQTYFLGQDPDLCLADRMSFWVLTWGSPGSTVGACLPSR